MNKTNTMVLLSAAMALLVAAPATAGPSGVGGGASINLEPPVILPGDNDIAGDSACERLGNWGDLVGQGNQGGTNYPDNQFRRDLLACYGPVPPAP